MRLFIAINLSEEERKQVLAVQNELKVKATRGNFTREENFHLTLAFLGEIPQTKVQVIEKVMDDASCGTFSLCFHKIDAFRRSGGSIYYLAAKPEEKAEKLSEYLRQTLSKRGFTMDDKRFVPHLTLGREIMMAKDETIHVLPITSDVTKISLMKSERINGTLTYTSIYEKML